MSPDSKDTPISKVTPPAEQPAAAKIWEDFVDIYVAPVSVFARRAHGSWMAAWAVLVVAVLATTLTFSSAMRPFVDNTMRASVQRMMEEMNPEQAGMAVGFARSAFVFGQPVALALGVFFGAFVLWVILRFFSLHLALRQTLTIATYATFPRIIEQIAKGVEAMLSGDAGTRTVYSLSYGPLRFLAGPDLPDTTAILLGHLELFSLWCLALTVIGIRTVGKTSTATAVLAAGAAWLLGILMPLIMTFR
jgi:hypothetical protein